MELLLISLVNTLVVSIAVLIHYEFLCRISQYLPNMLVKHRSRIVFGVAGALIAHVIEIWMFAVAYYLTTQYFGWGSLVGNSEGTLMDCFYYSFTSFTTLGFGDITPLGEVRYLTGIESLTGLVLITWSASFLFIEMQKHWDQS
jgi:hypothetical protein